MKWQLRGAEPSRTEDPREVKLREGLDGLRKLTERLNATVDEVMEGGLGAGERRR